MVIRTRGARLDVRTVAARGAFEAGPISRPPLSAALVFGEAAGECGKVAFAASACRFPQSRRIVCR